MGATGMEIIMEGVGEVVVAVMGLTIFRRMSDISLRVSLLENA